MAEEPALVAGLDEGRSSPDDASPNLGVLRDCLLPRFGRWPVSRIITADVKAMLAEESNGEPSPSAVRRHAIILGTILGAAVDRLPETLSVA